jgi:hypothetical protein
MTNQNDEQQQDSKVPCVHGTTTESVRAEQTTTESVRAEQTTCYSNNSNSELSVTASCPSAEFVASEFVEKVRGLTRDHFMKICT